MSSVKRIFAAEIDSTFASSIDLISAPLSSRIISFSDEWFASASNLTNPAAPIRRPGHFVPSGAWYDGWETRRHNAPNFDWVVIRLGVASGKVRGVEIDTAFFNGNHAPEISVEGTFESDDGAVAKEGYGGWEEILAVQECGPSERFAWDLGRLTEKAYTHVRLRMYPDGGIARFRLYGAAVPVFPEATDAVFDLAATVNGGIATSCSDEHFGKIANLILPGRGVDMGDGWETKRSRGEHVDWAIIKLGAVGEIGKIVLDTKNFLGNFPKEMVMYGTLSDGEPSGTDDAAWTQILSPQKAGPDREHEYVGELKEVKGKKYSHVKLVIVPDGGVKRIRVFGKRAV